MPHRLGQVPPLYIDHWPFSGKKKNIFKIKWLTTEEITEIQSHDIEFMIKSQFKLNAKSHDRPFTYRDLLTHLFRLIREIFNEKFIEDGWAEKSSCLVPNQNQLTSSKIY
ncbi:hypothetical protein BpHYR1_024555 [Brachionus plicatilis]|uniref:Uncharacterized protein n=1 Tax=Brachionus plicatilis TaxID=10195 RepID=A0A3M7PFW0_BRAPC|nr:hypothetical protein BpHYR1_024555 [Brachionus plicatilis]